MVVNHFDQDSLGGGDRLYADAVCAQCNTVNPDGSLLCKTCGNNLRDQRTIRLTAERELERDAPVDRSRYIYGGLSVLGILIVIWIALDADRLMSRLVNAGNRVADTSQQFWTGPDNAQYQEMLADLDGRTFTPEQEQAAIEQPIAGETFDGMYVLASPTPESGMRVDGIACVRTREEEFLFVARLNDQTEMRGTARLQGNYLTTTWDMAAGYNQENYFAISGVAAKQPDGSFECYGRSALSDASYEFLGFRLP